MAKTQLKKLNIRKFSKRGEKAVLRLEREIGIEALSLGKSLIVDDTNFHPKHGQFWAEVASIMDFKYSEITFDTSLEEYGGYNHWIAEKIFRDKYWYFAIALRRQWCFKRDKIYYDGYHNSANSFHHAAVMHCLAHAPEKVRYWMETPWIEHYLLKAPLRQTARYVEAWHKKFGIK